MEGFKLSFNHIYVLYLTVNNMRVIMIMYKAVKLLDCHTVVINCHLYHPYLCCVIFLKILVRSMVCQYLHIFLVLYCKTTIEHKIVVVWTGLLAGRYNSKVYTLEDISPFHTIFCPYLNLSYLAPVSLVTL